VSASDVTVSTAKAVVVTIVAFTVKWFWHIFTDRYYSKAGCNGMGMCCEKNIMIR